MFPLCYICSDVGDYSNHNCILCINGYILDPENPGNCIVRCKYQGKKWVNQTNLITNCYDDCPPNYPYLIIDTNECVSNCLYYDYYRLFEYKKVCYAKCPEGTSVDEEMVKCLNVFETLQKEKIRTINSIEIRYISKLSISTTMDTLNSYVSLALSQEGDKMLSIEGKDNEFCFYSTSTPIDYLKSNKNSVIELGKCEKILRKSYAIPEEEELYIATIVI